MHGGTSWRPGRCHLFLQWSYFSNVLLHRYFLLSQFESFHNKLSALELGGIKKKRYLICRVKSLKWFTLQHYWTQKSAVCINKSWNLYYPTRRMSWCYSSHNVMLSPPYILMQYGFIRNICSGSRIRRNTFSKNFKNDILQTSVILILVLWIF